MSKRNTSLKWPTLQQLLGDPNKLSPSYPDWTPTSMVAFCNFDCKMQPFFHLIIFATFFPPHVPVIASRGLQASQTSFPVCSFPKKQSRNVAVQQRTHTNWVVGPY